MIFSVTLLLLFFKNNFLCAQYLIFCCHLRGNVSVLSRKQTYYWTIITSIIYLVPASFDTYMCIDITFYICKKNSYRNTLRLALFFPFHKRKKLKIIKMWKCNSFSQVWNHYLLCIYEVPGTMLHTWNNMNNKTSQEPCPNRVTLPGGMWTVIKITLMSENLQVKGCHKGKYLMLWWWFDQVRENTITLLHHLHLNFRDDFGLT